MTTTIHPTAIIDPSAQLGENVQIGPFAIVEADTVIGDGCVLNNNAVIRRFTTLGAGNNVDSFAVLGGVPQDVKFDPNDETYVIIGDNNTFREGVTINRATTPGGATRVGNNTYWMVNSHAGHDSTTLDGATLVNSACLAGHSELGERCILSGFAGIHQFCWVGEGCLGQGSSVSTMHVPPFCIMTHTNQVSGLNIVGMRRAGYSATDRHEVKEAFALLFRSGLPTDRAIAEMDTRDDWGPAASKFRAFLHRVQEAKGPHSRGLIRYGSHRR
ncbi:MAG: acyl-ACP--UDP-N-acetylglucosamine O-acyltransferase [Phycisphaerales bacterium]|nr:acyl-ACP--UDP-N-acetylglucosamine O-acyltransferase [Phycisphaerales bacterium]